MSARFSNTLAAAALLAAGLFCVADRASAGDHYFHARSYYVDPTHYYYGPMYAPPTALQHDPAMPHPAPLTGAMYDNPAYYNYGRAHEVWNYAPNRMRYSYGTNFLGGRDYDYHFKRDGNRYRVREGWNY